MALLPAQRTDQLAEEIFHESGNRAEGRAQVMGDDRDKFRLSNVEVTQFRVGAFQLRVKVFQFLSAGFQMALLTMNPQLIFDPCEQFFFMKGLAATIPSNSFAAEQ